MSKKTIGIIVMVIAAGIWCLFSFWQEKGLEKYLFHTTQTTGVNTSSIYDVININKDEKLKGNYSWGTAAGPNQKQYQNAVWKAITTTRLAGIDSLLQAVEKKTEPCGGFSGSYLKKEGCMCEAGFWVEIINNGQVKKIDTAEKLISLLWPADNAVKAATLVVLTHRYVLINSNGTPMGHTLAIKDGYLVQTVNINFCGCSTHQPFGNIYKVTKAGVVTLIASEIVPRGNEPEVCVD